MTDSQVSLLTIYKACIILGFSVFYMAGGRNQHNWRRIGGALFLGLNLCILYLIIHSAIVSFLQLFFFNSYFLSLRIGYGADDFKQKIVRRLIYGLGLGFSALLIGYSCHSVFLAWSQFLMCVSSSIAFGVFNPFKTAQDEEMAIAIIGIACVPFMV